MKFSQLFLILSFSFLLFGELNAQSSKATKNLTQTTDNQWTKNIDYNGNFKNYFKENLSKFGLETEKDIQFSKTFSTKSNWNHHRFQQYYKGLEVLNGKYILHEKNGQIKKGNGNIFPNINLSTKPTFSKKQIETVAKKYAESDLRKENDGELPEGFNEHTLHTENPELVITSNNYPKKSGEYRLAYRLVVGYDAMPPRHDEYIIDAKNGKVISIIPQVCEINVDGIAKTRYYGEQTITVDSLSPNEFVLADYTRAEEGIFTNDNRNSNKPFSDEDNYWNNANEFQDEVAGDAHYCAISFYDYLKNKFDFNSIDNEGEKLISNVHINSDRTVVNAYWTGSSTNYGDGDCLDYGPLTTMDVVAHEFTHGLTQRTSNLIYSDEPGGLNEAISDIFGKAVEYQYDQANFTWEIGRKFIKSSDGQPFRDMSDPNPYGDPQYYKGKNWSNRGDVHTNSGVLNYWFHLLVEGKADTTETGVLYDVKAIGMEKAMDIVFEMETGYLMPDSDYFHAFLSSLEVTEDLFGLSSDEYVAVVEAWKAVGLWKPEPNSLTTDFSIKILELDSIYCGVDTAEFSLSVELTNLTNTVFPQGSEIELGHLFYIFGGYSKTEPNLETFVLTSDFGVNESRVFTFSELINFDNAGTYKDLIAAFIGGSTNDEFPFNDTTSQEILVSESLGQDMEISVYHSAPNCKSTKIRFNTSVSNNGCQPIPPGTLYDITLEVNGISRTKTTELVNSLEPESSIGDSFIIDISEFQGEKNLQYFGKVSFANDSDTTNNETSPRNLRLYENIELGYIQDFSSFEASDDPFLKVSNSSGCLYDLVQYQGNPMLGFSGDEEPRRMKEGCDEVFKVVNDNRQFIGKTEFCVNATEVENPTISYDLTYFFKENNFLVAPEHTSILRLSGGGISGYEYLVGEQEGQTTKHYISLPENFHNKITFESFTLTGSPDFIANNDFEEGDYILIDNIQFTDGTVGTDDGLIESDFKVFPNPTSGIVYFENISPFLTKFDIEIYNTLGAKILEKKNQSGKANVNISNLAKGIYFYKIRLENDLTTAGRLVVGQE